MRHRLKRFLMDERGVGAIPPLFLFLLIACILLYIAIDIYGYSIQKQKLLVAANEIIEIVKAENGFDAQTQNQFDALVQKLGLDPAKITVYGTPKLVQRGSPVEVVARMEYETIGLKPLGKSLSVPIEVTVQGLARTYIR